MCTFTETKKKEILSQQTPLWMSDDVEFWPESHIKFVHIAQLYSELVALSSTGQLYQWKWNEPEPYKHPVEVLKRIHASSAVFFCF